MIYQTALRIAREYNNAVPPFFGVEQPDRRRQYKHQWIQESLTPDEHLFDPVFELLEENHPADAFHSDNVYRICKS